MARTYLEASNIFRTISQAITNLDVDDDQLVQQISDLEHRIRDVCGEAGFAAIYGYHRPLEGELGEASKLMLGQDFPPELDIALAALEERYLTLKA